MITPPSRRGPVPGDEPRRTGSRTWMVAGLLVAGLALVGAFLLGLPGCSVQGQSTMRPSVSVSAAECAQVLAITASGGPSNGQGVTVGYDGNAVTARRASSGLWTPHLPVAVRSAPVVSDGAVYITTVHDFAGFGTVYEVNLQTGKLIANCFPN